MTRAEQAAMKAYPDYPTMDGGYVTQRRPRKVFIQGYELAEKDLIDLAQLWVDSGDANIMSFQRFLKCHETQGNK